MEKKRQSDFSLLASCSNTVFSRGTLQCPFAAWGCLRCSLRLCCNFDNITYSSTCGENKESITPSRVPCSFFGSTVVAHWHTKKWGSKRILLDRFFVCVGTMDGERLAECDGLWVQRLTTYTFFLLFLTKVSLPSPLLLRTYVGCASEFFRRCFET